MSGIERIDSGGGRRPLHGAAATRRLEAAALAAAPPFALMARAGAAVARLALALAPHARAVLVFAGPGNNGGDGIEAATRLCAAGKATRVVLVGDPNRRPADAARALGRAITAGVEVVAFASLVDAADGDGPGLVIDALLGFATARAPDGELAAALERIAALAARGAHVLAVDVPSGLDADRGRPLGPHCAIADDSLALLTLKPGLFTADGRDHAGRVWLATLEGDVDGPMIPTDAAPEAWLCGRADPACASSPRRHAAHKGSFGDLVVVGGAAGMAGAAWLAARAGHAAGAGRVIVDLLDGAAAGQALDPMRPELMARAGWWRSAAAEVLAATTVVCGCGGGEAVRAALPRLLATAPRLVLDADALNAVAADPALQAQLRGRAGRGLATVLTPHPLEAARLLGSDAGTVQADRLAAARALVDRFHCVAVLKGSGTVVAAPGEVPRIGASGNAGLASAGTGDVLGGWLGGRWAETLAEAFDVATRAVVEHGAAAEPERAGAMRAGDLVEELHRRSRGG